MAEYVNISEFSRRIGVTRRRVQLAIDQGKVKTKVVKGKKVIDLEAGKKAWDDNMSEIARKKNASGKKKEKAAPKNTEPKTFEGLTLADAERQEKVYKARQAQLKYNEQAGKLVDVDLVKRIGFEIGRTVRDDILQIPSRIAHELASETDPHIIENRLTKELNESLAKLSEAEAPKID